MSIGRKIRKLRAGRQMSQHELASQLGISQTTLHNIESGNSDKIDFLLMERICIFFKKDFSHFTNNTLIINNIQEDKGQMNWEKFRGNDLNTESILSEIKYLIDENKLLKEKVAHYEGK